MLTFETKKLPITQLHRNNGQVPGLPRNPRVIKDSNFQKLKASIQEDPEMLELREIIALRTDKDKYVIIGGNMRFEALKALNMETATCKVITGSPDLEQLKRIILKDNSAFGQWDFDILANEFEEAMIAAAAIEIPDFDEPKSEEEAEEDDFTEADEEKAAAVTKPGDIWQLGDHRLMCGDSTKAGDVARLMDGEKADLVFTDPPYGMKKEIDGVLNDNLNFDELLKFNCLWIPNTFAHLKDNGSWYCWGINEPLMDIYSNILKPMARANKITFRNLITWDKGFAQGQKSADLRNYATADEKCLFVMCGVQGFNVNADNYFEGWEPIRKYLAGEKEKMGWNESDIKRITGVTTVGRHCFNKSQFEFITETSYKKLQEAARGEAFKREYEDIKREYYSTRAYFDNTHDNFNNVWHFERTSINERANCGNHATPKPIALCARAIKSSSRETEKVLDTFGGSGSTLIACEMLKRQARLMELDAHYCDVIIARWEKLTGREAKLITNIYNEEEKKNG